VSDVELVVVADEQEAAALVAELLARAARAGRSIVLTGGSTPALAYAEAARRESDWSRAEVWWGDERCVPPEHELSNYALAKRTLLDNLEHGPHAVHRIKGERGKDQAAAEYDEALDDHTLDLLLLGLGPDGHVASLFPGSPQLLERERRVTSGEAGLEPFVDRVTLSLPTLCGADDVLFLLTGEAKADAARRAFAEPPGPETPASLVRSAQGRTTAILDRAAAAELPA